ncbi:MAG: hypothetical protein R3345_15300 [Fulvivirga sp.]|nr:hypothetical protein [Fulvivirga sp.]
MKYPLIAFGVVAFAIISFSLLFTNYSAGPSQQLNQVMAEESIDDCYDDTMTAWFIEFNEMQESGATMEEADMEASQEALNNFERCARRL